MSIELSINVWKIAPGDDACLWLNECYPQKYICIGNYPGNVISGQSPPKGDLRNYTKKQLESKFKPMSPIPSMLWSFVHDIQIGDIVIANKGRSKVCGIGIITSDYIPPNNSISPRYTFINNYENVRFVKWFDTKLIDISHWFVMDALQKQDIVITNNQNTGIEIKGKETHKQRFLDTINKLGLNINHIYHEANNIMYKNELVVKPESVLPEANTIPTQSHPHFFANLGQFNARFLQHPPKTLARIIDYP